MTADWFDFPHAVLRKISSRITNEVNGINRVTMDITSKPPGTVGELSSRTFHLSRSRTDARCDGKQNGYRDLERTRLLYFYLLLSQSLSVSFTSRAGAEAREDTKHCTNKEEGSGQGKKGVVG